MLADHPPPDHTQRRRRYAIESTTKPTTKTVALDQLKKDCELPNVQSHLRNMNKAKLKSYAPQARRDFIAAVTARANLLGLSEKNGQLAVAPGQTQGDVTIIAGEVVSAIDRTMQPTPLHVERMLQPFV